MKDDRFWANVDKSGDCWIWKGAWVRRWGYGMVRRDGRARLVHRWAWRLKYGKHPPADMLVCHHCDTPLCVNHKHLFLGTAKDNSDDMIRKGRARHGINTPFGESHPHAKLTDDKVKRIRLRYEELRSLTKVAKEFGVCFQLVSLIKNRKIWKHVP